VEQLSYPLPDLDPAELRQSTRFRKEPGTDSAIVWQHSGQEQLVDVYDESLGGMCLVLPNAIGFAVGSTATIVYHTDVLEGTVRNVRPQADGTFLVGFQCRLWQAG